MSALEDRCAELEAAIQHHRQQVGEAYGIGSYKRLHAVNMELWEHVGSVFGTAGTENADEPIAEAGLARPAMMEDDE